MYVVVVMALLKYLQREGLVLQWTLAEEETEQVNKRVRWAPNDEQTKVCKKCSACSEYTPKDRAKIGRYATENDPAEATMHFAVPKTTVRRLKSE